MADIYYTQASPDWEIESADVTTDQHNIHDRNFDSRYELTGADSATKRLYIDRLAVPISGSRTDVDTVAISMYSGSYVDWSSASFVIHQNVTPSMSGRVGSVSGSLGTYLDANAGLFVLDLPTDYTLRYVQIEAVGMPSDPIVTQVLLLRKHTTARTHSIRTSHQYPRWDTNIGKLDGPRTIRYNNFRAPIQIFRRHYPLYGSTDINQALNIFNDCRGMLYPFLYTDGISSKTYVCHMSKDEPRYSNIEQDHDEIVIEFEEIYRINPGYSI